MKEDLEHAKKTREEKPKTQHKFLQKYWHKGAFHQVVCVCSHTVPTTANIPSRRTTKFSKSTIMKKLLRPQSMSHFFLKSCKSVTSGNVAGQSIHTCLIKTRQLEMAGLGVPRSSLVLSQGKQGKVVSTVAVHI